MQMHEGTIKKVTSKGFGFIVSPDSEKELFFHASSLAKGVIFNNLRDGQKVAFDEIQKTEKGVQAVGVRPVEY